MNAKTSIPKFRSAYSFTPLETDYEAGGGISLTLPDDSYSVEDLLRRYANGIMPPVGRNVYFEDDPDFDNIDPTLDPSFDLSDATAIMQDLETKIKHRSRKKVPFESQELFSNEGESESVAEAPPTTIE